MIIIIKMYYVIWIKSQNKYVGNSRLRSIGVWYTSDLLSTMPFTTIGQAEREIDSNWLKEGGVVHIVRSEVYNG